MQTKIIFHLLLFTSLSFGQESRPIFFNNETDSVRLKAKKKVSFRFETHGTTEIEFNIQSENTFENLSYELVKISLKPSEKESIVTKSAILNSNLKMNLEQGGIYELRIKNKSAAGTDIKLKASCSGICARKTVKLSEYLKSQSEEKIEPFAEVLEKKLIEYGVTDPKIIHAVKNKDYSRLDTIATVQRLSDVKNLIPLITNKETTHKPDVKIIGKLNTQLAKYPVDKSKAMVEVIKTPVAIQWGHHYSNAMTQKQINQSEGLSKILTSLSVGNGSEIRTKEGKKIISPEQLFKYLLDTGHEIKVDYEKVNANFLAFAEGDKNILFPTYVRTGIILPSGKELKVPMNHTQVAWKISGPLVNARVAAFHGIGGVGFFPVTDERPDWSKAEVKNLLDSKKGDTLAILQSVEAAKNLVRLNRCEREKFAKGAAGDGYGLLGVCNDSTAYILSQMKLNAETRPLVPYPMMRPSEYNENDCKQTEKDPFTSLPHDIDDKNPDKITLLERILASVPRDNAGVPMLKEPELISSLKEAEEMLGAWKSAGEKSSGTSTSH